jgi:glycosyltransferase involved in cell wall biosynthesis
MTRYPFPLPISLSLCLPCFNEEAVIGDIVAEACDALPRLVNDFELVVVDDGSIDQTAFIVEEVARQDDRVRIVRHDRNRGYGATVTTALRTAKGEWTCLVDGDGQFSLLDLPKFLLAAHSSDVVVGYRNHRADNLIRRFNAFGWNRLMYYLFRLPLRDLDCGFKLFPRWVVDKLQLSSEGACISAEILIQCIRGGLLVHEVPVNHFPRSAGKATGANLGVVAKACREIPILLKYHRMPRWDAMSTGLHSPKLSPELWRQRL